MAESANGDTAPLVHGGGGRSKFCIYGLDDLRHVAHRWAGLFFRWHIARYQHIGYVLPKNRIFSLRKVAVQDVESYISLLLLLSMAFYAVRFDERRYKRVEVLGGGEGDGRCS